MKTKHTKGEWQVIEFTLISGWRHLAKIIKQDVGYEEAEANAKLIAAAPELLQNCIWCINNFKNVLPVATKEESVRIYASLIENLEEAIKKATE